MGYSCTAAAMNLLETYFVPSGEESNVWTDAHFMYFYEIATEHENEAGDIMGTIFKNLGHNQWIEYGNFCITGDGKNVIAPTEFAEFFWDAGINLIVTRDFKLPNS